MKNFSNAFIRGVVVVGLLGYVVFPWYAVADRPWYEAVASVLGGPEAANGIVQALLYGHKWLLVGVIGLVLGAMALSQPPGRGQARWLIVGGLGGGIGLAVQSALGGAGAFVALAALLGLVALGIARLLPPGPSPDPKG
jgi:iron(III) transport system permease protein